MSSTFLYDPEVAARVEESIQNMRDCGLDEAYIREWAGEVMPAMQRVEDTLMSRGLTRDDADAALWNVQKAHNAGNDGAWEEFFPGVREAWALELGVPLTEDMHFVFDFIS